MSNQARILFFSAIFLSLFTQLAAQTKVISGVVLDKQSDEGIPFASAVFKVNGRGELTDSLGRFSFTLDDWANNDTLEISSVGYKIVQIPVATFRDSAFLTIHIEVMPLEKQVVVKSKYNRSLWFWRKIIAHKDQNDKHHYDNYAYEVYNKLELDVDNINRKKFEKNLVFKPLNFILDYTDSTSEKEPFLPMYLTETISDFYYQAKPYKTREVIKATNASGFTNESWKKQLGATYQNIDVYNNTIPVFDKTFISPLSDNADNYYIFKLQDTQYLGGKRLVHLAFRPKRPGENTFEGDCWVHDTTFAIQKITLRPAKDVNINFVKGLSLIQEYKLINDSSWFLYKDKFIVDLAPLGDQKVGLKGRKTTTYRNIVVNSDSVVAQLNKSKAAEDIVVVPNTSNLSDSFWTQNRFEPLNKNEANIYMMLDSLWNNKTFVRYKNLADIASTGTKDIGNIRIGPWYYWITGNTLEGTRFRFDLATNRNFSDHWYFHGYLAYGTKDQRFKGQGEARYQFSRTPWSYLQFSYRKDLDNGQESYDQLSSDNVFAYLFRKPGIPFKFQQVEEKKLQYFTDTYKGLSVMLSAASKNYLPLLNLPPKELFPSKTGEALNTFETGIRLRYAYQERFIDDNNFERYTLGSDYPIVALKYTHGFQGAFSSSYKYDKLDLTVSDYIKLPPYGSLYYNLFAGKVFGTLPYQLLNIQPGNEGYYYTRNSFNLMKRFEYITDQYVGFNVEHNIGTGIFRYLAFTRKLKFRQFWEAKGVTGNLSAANKQLNFVGDYPFKSLDGKWYAEVGTGVDNILKFFRVDFIWRVSPHPLPQERSERFGVFFGFRVSL